MKSIILFLQMCTMALSASSPSPAFVPHGKASSYKKLSTSLPMIPSAKSHKNNNNNDDDEGDEKCINHKTDISNRREWLVVQSSKITAASTILSTTATPSRASAASTILEAPPPTTTTTPTTTLETSGTTIPSLCDPSVSIWTKTLPSSSSYTRIIYLLGTAHISTSSAETAGQLVRSIKPDAVFVELDAKRVAGGGNVRVASVEGKNAISTQDGSVQKETRIVPSSSTSSSSGNFEITSNESSAPKTPSSAAVAAQGGGAAAGSGRSIFDVKGRMLDAGSKMVGDSIRGLYKKLGAEGFNPGEEFVVAVKEGLAVGSQIVLGDRDVDVTLRRLTEALSKTDLKKLASSDSDLEKSMREFLPSGSSPPPLSSSSSGKKTPTDIEMEKEYLSKYVEVVKARENVRLIMKSVQDAAPELYNAMVAERDEYMGKGLDKIDMFPCTVAVMGIAHVDGVEKCLEERGWRNVRAVDCSPRS